MSRAVSQYLVLLLSIPYLVDLGGTVHSSEASNDTQSYEGSVSEKKIKLKLLVVLPLRLDDNRKDRRDIQSWDHGSEILPGAQLAVEDINNDPDLLPGYELELVNKSNNPCLPLEVQTNLDVLIPFAKGFLDNNIVGMLGLFCYRLLRSLSPLVGRDVYGLFQLSGTTSPHVRGRREKYTHLNFIAPSEASLYQAFFMLMNKLSWRRLLIIDDDFFDLTHIPGYSQLTRNMDLSFLEFYKGNISIMIEEVKRTEKNIVYVSAGARQTASLLCEAHNQGLLWPHYVWVLQDNEISDLLTHARGSCTTQKLTETIKNSFLINTQDEQVDTTKELVSGHTYEEYLRRYTSVLENVGLSFNKYANVMYDSVWAFALALNMSLDRITEDNETLIDFVRTFGRTTLTNLIETNLRTLSFDGASGRAHFNDDYDIDAVVYVTFVDHNTTTHTIGVYDQLFPGNFSIDMSPFPAALPHDRLPNVYNLVPLPVTIVLASMVILCLLFTSIQFFLFVKYRRYSEIKAASPYLSLLMFAGTYLILISTFIQAILITVVSPEHGAAGAALCGSVISGDVIGVNLIFSTLLLRMLRIYRIFSYFGKTGKVWSDKVLAFVVFMIIGGDLALLLIWIFVDPFTIKSITIYVYASSPPHYTVTQYCSSNNIELWFSLIFGKMAVLFVIVLFLAIKTRKIQRTNFKDTKKVNIYMFLTVIIIAGLVPVWFLLRGTGNRTVVGTGIVIYVAFGATGLLNQIMLFSPKVLPLVLRSLGLKIGHSPRSRYGRATVIKKNLSSSGSARYLINSKSKTTATAARLPSTRQ